MAQQRKAQTKQEPEGQLMKFKLLNGIHVQDDPTQDWDDEAGRYPERQYAPGDTVHSFTDLAAKHGQQKFSKLDGTDAKKRGTKSILEQMPDQSKQGVAFPGGQVVQGLQETTEGGGPNQASGPQAVEDVQAEREGSEADQPKQAKKSEAEEQPAEGEAAATVEEDYGNLEGYKVADLKKIAETEGIDLGDAKTKEQIIEVLRGSR